MRLAWDTKQSPKALVEELHQKFYGSAAKEMADYWHFIDRTWVDVPEYAGCGFGHLRRWTKERLAEARKHMDRARAAAKTALEKDRIALADESLALFEHFIQLRRDLADGKFGKIGADANRYVEKMEAAAKKHQPNYCFAHVPWAFGGKGGSVNSVYFRAFYDLTYQDAARIARDNVLLTPVLRQWRWKQDREKKGEAGGWSNVKVADGDWKTTDVAVDTWSALGLHNYMGPVWYRAKVKVPAVPKGKKAYLWIGATDGSVKVFVNGRHVPYIGEKGKKADTFSGYCQPASFDVTAALVAGEEQQVALLCTRTFLNELGTGGLLAPPVVYREKD